MLKHLPLYSDKINKINKNIKKFANARFLSELPFFLKKSKKLTNYQLSKELSFFPRKSKWPKRLTKHQILKNILPFYDSVDISRKHHAFRNYAETYKVEVVDRTSLNDSLLLAKSSIIDWFLDLLKEKRGFKYILSIKFTLKRWNNVTNTDDIDTFFRNSDTITITNKRFDLGTAFDTLKHRLIIYSGEGSAWIIDKIEDIWINISNKDIECFKLCNIRFY